MTKIINKTVNVSSVRFGKNLIAYPAKFECDGQQYEFVDSGLALTVQNRGVVSRILTLSDGLQQLRLRNDGRGDAWTLLSVSV